MPAYGILEAAQYLRLPPSTLRDWVKGRSYPTEKGRRFSAPLISLLVVPRGTCGRVALEGPGHAPKALAQKCLLNFLSAFMVREVMFGDVSESLSKVTFFHDGFPFEL